MCEKWILITLVALSGVILVKSATMVDDMFEEALLNSITPELKQKLVKVHEEGTAKKYSTNQMKELLKKRLLPKEVKELENAYKRLLLPLLQSALESKLHRGVDIDDVPMNIFESEEEIPSDNGVTPTNGTQSTRKNVEKNDQSGKKKDKKPRNDPPRDMGPPKKSITGKDGNIESESDAKSKKLSNIIGNKDEL